PVEPVKVAVDSGPVRGTEPGGAETGGAETGGAEPRDAEPRGAETRGAEPGGAEPGGAVPRALSPTGGLTERREPESRLASPVRAAHTGRRVPRQRPPAVLGTHQMALRPSTAPQR
ncbi:unnamed protein product, partial [Closterium sp. NIES-53]